MSIFDIDIVNRMNLQQLEYIIAVDRLKSFSKAAKYCNVTQATLSTMVKKLEEELSVTLFDRKSNPVITTDIGAVLIKDAKKVVFQAGMMKDKAKTSGAVEGSVRIGMIPTVANSLLPKIIKPILKAYPKLHLEISEITTHSMVKQLKEGGIDMGILATPVDLGELEEEILYYETLMVYGDIKTNQAQYIVPEEIREHKIWLLEEGHCIREQFIKLCALRKKEDVPQNFSFEANSFDTLLSMVDTFGGLTLIPELYYQTLATAKKKNVRFFSTPVPVREVSLVYARPFARQRIIKALADIIRTIVGKDLLSNQYKKSELMIARI